MSGSFTPVDTAGDVTLVEGIIQEGEIQARDGDVNLNLHDYNGRGVVLAVLPDGGDSITRDETVELTLTDATGGTLDLGVSVDGGGVQTAAAIAFDATSAQLKTAIVALSNVGAQDVDVVGDAGGPYTITFGGALAGTPIAVTVDGSDLTGVGAAADVVELVAGTPAGAESRYRFAAAEIAGEYPDA